MAYRSAAFVAVDWGTSHLRVWLLAADGSVLAERRSDQGMAATPREQYEAILDAHLDALAVPADIPVIMCGMVGSRQGWVEAGYLPVPVSLDRIPDNAARVDGVARDIRILPGLSRTDFAAPDVMRSEETQLFGLSRLSPVADDMKRIVCMPGTHSKWVHMEGRSVIDFASFITGDMYAVMAAHSVLHHSLSADSVDPKSPAFKTAVEASLSSPADLLARLFSIRAAGLLHNLLPADARASLSGCLIGQEIAGALPRFSTTDKIDLVAGNTPGTLYAEALAIAGVQYRSHDGDALVIAGLTGAASALWKNRSVEQGGTSR